MLDIPNNLKSYLEVVDVSNFNEDRYFITDNVKTLLATIDNNYKLSKRIHELGFSYLNTTLLYGRAGTGKTYASKYVAYKHNMPFAYINFSKLLGNYGESNRILSDIFKFMSTQKCVFMLDEIDCIAKKRTADNSSTSVMLSSNTITLMQELDYYRDNNFDGIILGATNRVDTLDEALLSRFAIKYEMVPLNNKEKCIYLTNCLKDANLPYDEQNIIKYCNENSRLEQRSMELDLIQGIANYIADGEQGRVVISHIR